MRIINGKPLVISSRNGLSTPSYEESDEYFDTPYSRYESFKYETSKEKKVSNSNSDSPPGEIPTSRSSGYEVCSSTRFLERYSHHKRNIATGGCASISLIHERSTGKAFALKTAMSTPHWLIWEWKLHVELDHPSIIRAFDFYVSRVPRDYCSGIVMELGKMSLFDIQYYA